MFGTNKNIKILCLLIIIENRKRREVVSYFQVTISLIVLVSGKRLRNVQATTLKSVVL